MKKTFLAILLLGILAVVISYSLGSCRKNNNSNNLTLLDQEIPEGFPSPVYTFTDNPLTKEGFELGRKLFYDGRLSVDGAHPCSSCHQQIAAFGTYEHDRSHGVNNSHTLRNAPVLFNLAWQDKFHWDGEFNSLFDEAAQPINGHIEMGETFNGVIDKLQKDADYRKRFREVFHAEFIRPEFILKASLPAAWFLLIQNMTGIKRERLVSLQKKKRATSCSGCIATAVIKNLYSLITTSGILACR